MKKGFTILEMIIVLTIIALVFLLTLPNIRQKKEIINTKGCEALVDVINAQILLYEVDKGSVPESLSELVSGGYIKETQTTCPNGSNITLSNGQAYGK
ncbi:MAG: competence type IV pilus major pilin ComGC [Breznakia sp.]